MNNIISNKTVFLIDGSYYIFRAYYGFSSSILNEGAPMNAVYGFTLMLFNFLKKYKPYYLAIAFDSKAPTFRKKIYKLYKSNRLPTPNNLISQFIFIYKIVNAFNIKSLIKDGYEADDLIGTVTKFFKNANKTVVIVSSDKDFMQLVDQNVFLLKKIKKNGLNHDVIIKNREVIKKFGVSPKHVIDVLALAGIMITDYFIIKNTTKH